jgi:hypothetical protein
MVRMIKYSELKGYLTVSVRKEWHIFGLFHFGAP